MLDNPFLEEGNVFYFVDIWLDENSTVTIAAAIILWVVDEPFRLVMCGSYLGIRPQRQFNQQQCNEVHYIDFFPKAWEYNEFS